MSGGRWRVCQIVPGTAGCGGAGTSGPGCGGCGSGRGTGGSGAGLGPGPGGVGMGVGGTGSGPGGAGAGAAACAARELSRNGEWARIGANYPLSLDFNVDAPDSRWLVLLCGGVWTHEQLVCKNLARG